MIMHRFRGRKSVQQLAIGNLNEIAQILVGRFALASTTRIARTGMSFSEFFNASDVLINHKRAGIAYWDSKAENEKLSR